MARNPSRNTPIQPQSEGQGDQGRTDLEEAQRPTPETEAERERETPEWKSPPVLAERPLKRYRLLARAFMDGALREPGHIFPLPEGQLGPHRTIVHGPDVTNLAGERDNDRTPASGANEPLYVEIDEGLERERAELAERHAREREELDPEAARARLARKHGEELADLARRERLREMQVRHAREREGIEARQASEQAGFKLREEAPPVPVAPSETDAEALSRRHAEELAALETRQKQEAEALEAEQGEAEAQRGQQAGDEPEKARSITDEDWETRPDHAASVADADWRAPPGPQPLTRNPAPPSPPTQAPGNRPMNRPFLQSGPGHDPNVPS